MFAAQTPLPTYWQVAVLTDFDGTAWLPDPTTEAAAQSIALSPPSKAGAKTCRRCPSPPPTKTFRAEVTIGRPRRAPCCRSLRRPSRWRRRRRRAGVRGRPTGGGATGSELQRRGSRPGQPDQARQPAKGPRSGTKPHQAQAPAPPLRPAPRPRPAPSRRRRWLRTCSFPPSPPRSCPRPPDRGRRRGARRPGRRPGPLVRQRAVPLHAVASAVDGGPNALRVVPLHHQGRVLSAVRRRLRRPGPDRRPAHAGCGRLHDRRRPRAMTGTASRGRTPTCGPRCISARRRDGPRTSRRPPRRARPPAVGVNSGATVERAEPRGAGRRPRRPRPLRSPTRPFSPDVSVPVDRRRGAPRQGRGRHRAGCSSSTVVIVIVGAVVLVAALGALAGLWVRRMVGAGAKSSAPPAAAGVDAALDPDPTAEVLAQWRDADDESSSAPGSGDGRPRPCRSTPRACGPWPVPSGWCPTGPSRPPTRPGGRGTNRGKRRVRSTPPSTPTPSWPPSPPGPATGRTLHRTRRPADAELLGAVVRSGLARPGGRRGVLVSP